MLCINFDIRTFVLTGMFQEHRCVNIAATVCFDNNTVAKQHWKFICKYDCTSGLRAVKLKQLCHSIMIQNVIIVILTELYHWLLPKLAIH